MPNIPSLQVLANIQLAKHGKDRYPGLDLQLIKLVSEVGELADALLKWRVSAAFGPLKAAQEKVISELCDVALSVAMLANKLGIDLDQEVAALVEHDERRFNQ